MKAARLRREGTLGPFTYPQRRALIWALVHHKGRWFKWWPAERSFVATFDALVSKGVVITKVRRDGVWSLVHPSVELLDNIARGAVRTRRFGFERGKTTS